MIEIIFPDTLPAIPWKNGGGLTREIAKQQENGAVIWRLSIADITSDGPFSRFDGLTRILTVIEGAGVDLRGPDGVMQARLLQPVRFSGDLPIVGCLTHGPIRDLNVIFDATRVAADVGLLKGPQRIDLGPGQTGCLVMTGRVQADDVLVPPAAFAFGTRGQIALGPTALALIVTLHLLR